MEATCKERKEGKRKGKSGVRGRGSHSKFTSLDLHVEEYHGFEQRK
jgi:hypothetical protein